MRKYKKGKISSILAALLIVALLAPSFGNLSLAAEETSSEYDTQTYKVICTETWDFEDQAQMEDFDLYRSSNLSIQDGILKTAGRYVGTKAMVKTPFKSGSVKSVSVDIIPGTSECPVDAAILLGASDVDADETTMNALAFILESNYTGWTDAPNRIDLVTGSFPWTQHGRLISETGNGNALYKNGEKKPLNLKLDFADDGITATLSLVEDSSKYVQTTYSCDTSEIVGQIGLRAQNSDASFDNLRIEYSKTASGQQAVYESQVTYAAGSTIIMDMKGTNASGDVSGELFRISDDGMAIGGYSCSGTFETGVYGIKAFLNPTQESVLVEVTLPNGGIIRRGSSSLLYGCTSITEIVASWCGIENPVTGQVTYENINVQEYTVNTSEPVYEGFDANVYNLVTSFDEDAKTTRAFAWTALKSFVGDDTMSVQYRQQGTTDWNSVDAVKETEHPEGVLKASGSGGEMKAILNESFAGGSIQSVSVDIIPGTSSHPMDAGIYLGASNANNGQDLIDALAFLVDSNNSSDPSKITFGAAGFAQGWDGWKDGTVLTSMISNNNALFTDSVKKPLNLKLDFEADKIVATLSLVEDSSKYIQTTYACDTSTITGQIGLRAQVSDVTFDNLKIVQSDETEATWDFASTTQAEDFTFYKSGKSSLSIREERTEAYFKADITGLVAGTTYEYKIGKTSSDNDWSDVYTFTTETENSDEFSFITIGDTQGEGWTGYGYMYAQSAVNQAVSEVGSPAFVLHTGDVSENAGVIQQWNQYFKALGDVAKSVPHFAAIGNHDTRFPSDNFDLHFNHPNNGGTAAFTAQSITDVKAYNYDIENSLMDNLDETTYSFNYGKTHFITLNTGVYSGDQYIDGIIIEGQRAWLENDLKENADAEWTIILQHQPIYHSTDSNESRPWLYDLIEEYEVDLVLQGHSHYVTRTYPMKNGEIVSKKVTDTIEKGTGTIYLTVGATTTNHTDLSDGILEEMHTVFSPEATQPTYTTIKIDDKAIKVTIKQINGLVVDELTIQDESMNKFSGTTLDLEGKIGFNFYIDKEHTLSQDAYVEFDLPNQTKQTVALKDAVETENGLKFTCLVPAKEMADTVVATLYDGETVMDTQSISVRDYAETIIKNEKNNATYTAATPLMKSMLHYGKYAQTLFKYNTEDFANKNYIADDKTQNITVEDFAAYAKGYQGLSGFGQLAGASLILKGETTLRLFFAFENSVDLTDLKFCVNGVEQEYIKSGSYYIVECANIGAKDLDLDYKVTVMLGETTKFEAVCSAMTFCYNALNNASTEDALKNVSRALYLYNDEANQYMQGKTVFVSEDYKVLSGALSDSSKKGFNIQDGKLVSPYGVNSKAIYTQSISGVQSVSVDVYPGTDGKFRSGFYLGASGAGDAGDTITAENFEIYTSTDTTTGEIFAGVFAGCFPTWAAHGGATFNDSWFTDGVKPVNLKIDLAGTNPVVTLTLLDGSKTGTWTCTSVTSASLQNGQVGLRFEQQDCYDNFTVTTATGTTVVDFDDSSDLNLFNFYNASYNVTEGVVTVGQNTLALHKTESFANGTFSAELNSYKEKKAAGIVFGAKDEENYYLFRLTGEQSVELVKVKDGVETVLDTGYLSAGHNTSNFNCLEVVREGNSIYCYYKNQYDNVKCYAVCDDSTPLLGASIGLWAETPSVAFRNVKISHTREVRKADVLIFGHSYTEMWNDYETYFTEYESIDNIGIGGSIAKHWEEDLIDEVIAYEPKLGIYNIGINDFSADYEPKAVVDSIENAMLEVKKALPEFEVVLVSISHCPARSDEYFVTRIAEANALMRSLVAEYDWMHYAEAEYLFCTDKTDPSSTDAQYFLSDNLHPSVAGYQLMAESIKSALRGENQPVALKYDFSDATQLNDFDLYSTGANSVSIENEVLKTNSRDGQKKVLTKTSLASGILKSVSVDIIPGTSDRPIDAGILLGASNAATDDDMIDALGFLVDSTNSTDPSKIIFGTAGFAQGWGGWKDGTVLTSMISNNNALFTDGVKKPLNLRLDFYAGQIVATLSLVEDSSKYIQTTYACDTSTITGQIGLRAQYSDVSFDNLVIVYLSTAE